VVAVLHDLDLAANYADFLVLMHEGKVLAAGRPEQVFRPDLLQQAYHWPIKVARSPDGLWLFNAHQQAARHVA